MSILLTSIFGLSIVAFFILISRLFYLILNKKYGALARASKIKLIIFAAIPLGLMLLFGYLANVERSLVSNIVQVFLLLLALVFFAFFAKKRKAQKNKLD